MKTSKKAKPKEKLHRFIGISLAGGKTDKTCIAVIEYYPQFGKIFLAKMQEKIKSEMDSSSDQKVVQFIEQFHRDYDSIAFDVPLSFPPCIGCSLKCPGIEACTVPEVQWMRLRNAEAMKSKKPKKLITPYTQRASEFVLSERLEDKSQVQQALGANLAPLTARASFLKGRIKGQLLEVLPRLSLWRMGQDLKVNKSHLKFHRHAIGGDESRMAFLKALGEQSSLFIYDQDLRAMAENNHAFEAFLAALTGFLKFTGQTEPRPKGFPKKASWVEFPSANIKWKV